MNNILSLLFFIPMLSNAQDCSSYLFMSDNSTVQMTVYDKKGKESGTQTWKISEVKKNGNQYESVVAGSFKDEKGKEIANSSGVYKCEGGVLKADVRMSMPQQQMEAYKDAEAKFETAYIEYPSNISVGQTLKDVDFTMEVTGKNNAATTINYKMVNRKVNSQEKVTTPAGTWDAYVISYNSTFKTQIGPIGLPINMEVKEWFVPGIGTVKSETYNKAGKLAGSTMITSITK